MTHEVSHTAKWQRKMLREGKCQACAKPREDKARTRCKACLKRHRERYKAVRRHGESRQRRGDMVEAVLRGQNVQAVANEYNVAYSTVQKACAKNGVVRKWVRE